MTRLTAKDFSPELLQLYDGYAHGRLSKREFLDRAGRFAVAGLTAPAILAALSPNYAMAQQVDFTDPEILPEYVTYPSPDGHGEVRAYMVRPAAPQDGQQPGPDTAGAGPFPAVVVVHENRGLNPYIEDVARRLAKAGFLALAPDGLSSVGGYPGSDEKGLAAFRQVDGKKMTEDFVAAAKWLKTRPDSKGKLGAVGFCFGGGMVNQLAVRLGPDLNAGVAFYGRQAAVEDVPKISAPLLLQYAGNDQRINEGIAAYEAALKANNKVHQVYMYEGKQHGFHNDTTPRYDEEAAKLAWTRTLEFFNKHLR